MTQRGNLATPQLRTSLNGALGTPQPILDRLTDALDRALDDENVRRRLAEIGCDVPDKARRGQPPLAALVTHSDISARFLLRCTA